jgi:hypothetical protein
VRYIDFLRVRAILTFSQEQPTPNILLQPQSYQPAHQRDMSNASSVYSENRMSTLDPQRKRSDTADSSYSDNYNYAGTSNRTSMGQQSSSLQPNGSTNNQQSNDPRFSEFYDAYYRQSQLLPSKNEAPKRPGQLDLSDQTIAEVPTPLASPAVPHHQPGSAM